MSLTSTPISAQLSIECGNNQFNGNCRAFGGIPGITITVNLTSLITSIPAVGGFTLGDATFAPVITLTPPTGVTSLINPAGSCQPITCWSGCDLAAQSEFNPSTGVFESTVEGKYQITAQIQFCPITVENLRIFGDTVTATTGGTAALDSFIALNGQFFVILDLLLFVLTLTGAICPSVSIVRSSTNGCQDELARATIPIPDLATCGVSVTLKACQCLAPTDKVFLVVNNVLPIPIFIQSKFTQICIEQLTAQNCLCPLGPR